MLQLHKMLTESTLNFLEHISQKYTSLIYAKPQIANILYNSNRPIISASAPILAFADTYKLNIHIYIYMKDLLHRLSGTHKCNHMSQEPLLAYMVINLKFRFNKVALLRVAIESREGFWQT